MHYPHPALVDLEQLIDHCQPESLLCIGDELSYSLHTDNASNKQSNAPTKTHKVAANYCEQRQQILNPCSLTEAEPTVSISNEAFAKRYDLAVITASLEVRSKAEGQQLLSRLRDLCSPRIILLINFDESEWHASELLGFGLTRLDHYPINSDDSSQTQTVGLYHYNIDSYKQTPDWLNANHWANPALWDKVWW